METIGIIRSIDDLGRIAIPKEIRRRIKLHEGDQMEIIITKDEQLLLKKFSPLEAISKLSQEYIDSLSEVLEDHNIIITNQDKIIAIASGSKKEFLNKEINEEIRVFIKGYQHKPIVTLSKVIAPIIVQDHCVGTIIISSNDNTIAHTEIAIAKAGAKFLSKQISI